MFERNRFEHEGRLMAAARELSGASRFSPGLGCNCRAQPMRGVSGLRGYRAVSLSGTLRWRHGLAATPPQGVPALIPISDRNAVANAIRAFQRR